MQFPNRTKLGIILSFYDFMQVFEYMNKINYLLLFSALCLITHKSYYYMTLYSFLKMSIKSISNALETVLFYAVAA